MKYILSVLLGFLIFNCEKKQTNLFDVNELVNQSIETSGGKKIANSVIDFDFRDIHYKAIRNQGKYQYVRVFKDSLNEIEDYLGNNGFRRYINDTLVNVSDSLATKYTASVNSVHYFSVLPYGLDGKAVNKAYLGTKDIKGSSYHKIKVTFNEEGGGEDFDDVFIYWIHYRTNKVEYLAYSYNDDDGSGLRFRESYNERYIYNIRFVDYNNYKPKDISMKLEDLDNLFIDGQLELVSKIELKNIVVN